MVMRIYKRARVLAWMAVLVCVALLPSFGTALADDDDDDDDDWARAAVIISEPEGDTRVAEGGGSDGYTIVLSRPPRRNVYITLAGDGQTRVEPTSITFTRGNWDEAQAIAASAVDDDVAEGPHTGVIRHTVSSADGNDDAIAVADVVVHITDNDTAGVSVAPTAVRVEEGGATGTYGAELTSRPTAEVVIRITSGGQTTVEPSRITIAPDDWRQPRSLTVSAVDDSRVEGEHGDAIRHDCASADPAYDGIAIADVAVTIADNDRIGISISPRELEITEGGEGARYAISLEGEPAGIVTVRIATDELISTSPTEVRFTPEDWQEPRWVTITAVGDDADEGMRTSEVRHTLVSDGDVYDAAAVEGVTVTIHDDDRAGVVVSSGVDITERDGSTRVALRLTSRPTADVVIPLSASSDRCLLSDDAVRLTRDTWEDGAEITVSANVGASWYGEETCTIAVGPTSSADRSYDGLDPDDAVVTIRVARAVTALCIPMVARGWPPLPGTPVLHPVDNPDGRGDYVVAWGSADRAEAYLLQEAGDPRFASPQEAYRGPGLDHAVAGRGAGRYFYRVAATNAWGISPWSQAVAVDVRWEAEPNDDALAGANGPIWPDVTYHGVLGSDDDVQDYYRLELPLMGSIEVWLDDIPADHNYDLVVRDASLGDVGYSGELDNRGEHILTDALPAGTYYLQVYQRSGGGSPEPYALRYALP